jgi:Leucine-rich repeat (LRR) protein
MRRLSSLYLESNQIEDMKPVEGLKGLMSLSLSKNKITDISAVSNLDSLYWLFLDGNKIADLTPLANAAKKDYEGDKHFSPYLNLFVAGNPLNSASKKQLSTMKDYGTRINN